MWGWLWLWIIGAVIADDQLKKRTSPDQHKISMLVGQFRLVMDMKNKENVLIFNMELNPKEREDGDCDQPEACTSLHTNMELKVMLLDKWHSYLSNQQLPDAVLDDSPCSESRLTPSSEQFSSNSLMLEPQDNPRTGPRTKREDVEVRGSRKLLATFDILSALYESTNGGGWSNKANWMNGDPCSNSWYGTLCSSGIVTYIYMNDNSMQGSMPSQLGLLTELTVLALNTNSFSGSLPSQLGLMTWMSSSFFLYSNMFTGSIPSELGLMTNLESYLSFESNSLSGTIPSQLGQLTQFSFYFSLEDNLLTGLIPSEFGLLTLLNSHLHLFSNQLTGTIPSELGLMSLLTYYFSLNFNSLTGSIPSELGAMTGLASYFSLFSNQLSGSIPSELGQMSFMESIFYVHVNSLTGAIPSQLGRFSLMKSDFLVFSNQLSDSIPSELGKLTAMTSYFGLFTNDLTGAIPSQLGQMNLLTFGFYLNSNTLTGSIPSQLGRLTQVTSQFNLYSNQFCGDVPSQVSALSSSVDGFDLLSGNICVNYETLATLYNATRGKSWSAHSNWLSDPGNNPCPSGNWYGVSCSSNKITNIVLVNNGLVGALPTQLGLLTALSSLQIATNVLSSSIPSQLGLLTAISTDFFLYSNGLTGSLPSELGQLTQLKAWLSFRDNSLSGSLPSQLGQLTSLTIGVSLYSNQLSQSVPSELGQLTGIIGQFYLFSNQFTGALPSEFGQFSLFAQNFYMYSNSFSGSIPSQLGLMTSMTSSFQLLSNQLSGSIPSQLGQMSFMGNSFYLHSNLLTGSIPSQLGALTQMTNAFYLNANSLCASIIPSQVAALSALVFGFDVTTDNVCTYEVLSMFYSATSGSLTWGASTNWMNNAGDNPCSPSGAWYGLTCSSNDLIGFGMFANNLRGSLPSQLGLLTKIVFNDFSYNSLSGSLPSEMGQQTLISNYFQLESNSFNGSIPSELGLMTNLESYLSFESNSLSGTIPSQLGQLTQFSFYFSLEDNLLTGLIPSELGLLSNITGYLSFLLNHFTGAIPSQFGQLTGLENRFLFTSNSLSGSVPSQLGRLSLLSVLFQLDSNRFTNLVPSELGRLTSLSSGFLLDSNSFSGSLPSQLGRLVSMSANFDLSNNEFCGDVPEQLSALSSQVIVGFDVVTNNSIGTLCCETISTLTCPPTSHPTPTPSPPPTPYPTPLPTSQPTLLPTSQPTPYPTPLPTSQATPLPTSQPTPFPTPLPTSQPTPLPTSQPTPYPTPTPTPKPSQKPSPAPTTQPTSSPTPAPTTYPTPLPTPRPTLKPSRDPTTYPTPLPTPQPTLKPSPAPTPYPTPLPTPQPSQKPSPAPTTYPTPLPTPQPTLKPSRAPTPYPTPLPTPQPSQKPSSAPTTYPTPLPTPRPSQKPSPAPTTDPTRFPTPTPSIVPSLNPTTKPTPVPTHDPLAIPSPVPTSQPSPTPSLLPTPMPSLMPTPQPSPTPSLLPTSLPSLVPTLQPSPTPSLLPTLVPSQTPTSRPFPAPTALPTTVPSHSVPPSQAPTVGPTSLPTSAPTLTCVSGQYFTGSLCVDCTIGRYSNFNNTPPYPSSCSLCPAGQYNTISVATFCLECAIGKLSSSDRSYCRDCEPGEYNFNNTACIECEYGKYAPQAQTGQCLTCDAGFHTNNVSKATICTSCDAGTYSNGSSVYCSDCNKGTYSLTSSSHCFSCDPGKYSSTVGASSCSNCANAYSSSEGSSSCALAAVGYFLKHPSEESFACPKDAQCLGGLFAPLPDSGYWVDRSSYGYATDIYSCPRDTCKGGNVKKLNGSCWIYPAYNHSNNLYSLCGDPAELLCAQGASGPLCGSCDTGYVYRGETKTCSTCGNAKTFAFTVVGITSGMLGLVVGLIFAYRKSWISLEGFHFDSFDVGSLKVLWVTYQIIMSVSWNLDIRFPAVFSRMLSLLSVLSLEILSLECFSSADASDRYFITVYLWSVLPILLAMVIVAIGLGRFVIASSSKSQTAIINQHAWLLLLLSYLVLPPVAMKQLQGLDCIPFNHDKASYLRVDTGVNCRSQEYYTFKSIVILFFCLYQMIPVLWMSLLYQKRQALYVSRGPNEISLLRMRDADPSLSYLRFLFKDYRGEKWWFEVAEMYRRIMYVGVLPLFTPDSSKRASLGVLFAIVSFIYFREEEPFRVAFTNSIACVAQLTILLTFYTALSIDSGAVYNFGLGEFGIGLFLVGINVLVFALVLYLALIRFRRLQSEQQWRQVLTTEQLELVNRVMSGQTKKSSHFEEGDVDNVEKEGIELSSEAKRKSVEEKDEITSEMLKQYLLQPKVVVLTKKVGAGAFGEVFKGTCMGETVAIKTMIDVTEDNVREFKSEIVLTATLRHPNIVNFVGACWGKELMCLVLEWVAKGSLRDLLETPDLKWGDPLLKLTNDIARGMDYLHNRKFYDEREEETVACILHRDLKPDNVLISEYIAGKLADFGTSRSKGEEDVTMTAVGTPLYVAPEIARGELYDEKVDVYSFGLTLLEISVEQPILEFIGQRWVTAFNKKKIPKQPMRLIHPMTQEGWRPVTEENPIPFAPRSINQLIINCCDHNASKRPSFHAVLNELNSVCKTEIDHGKFARRTLVQDVDSEMLLTNEIEDNLAKVSQDSDWIENPFSNSIDLRNSQILKGDNDTLI